MYKNGIKIDHLAMYLESVPRKYVNSDIKLIRCGGGDKIISDREQWKEGSNTLAINHGEVVVYSKNYMTNRILQYHGVKTHIFQSSELSCG